MTSVRIVGPGRAGSALALALDAVGWTVLEPRRRGDELENAASDVDLVVIATPDSTIADVASMVEPRSSAAVIHLAGSLGPDILADHERRGALHPLVALPDAAIGAKRLRAGAWFAVAGDQIVDEVVADLGGRSFVVADEHRASYHAAACIASNHVVALLGQAQRVAATAGVPLEAYLDLVRATVDNVAELGPADALTGPVARGDQATIDRHIEALHPDERSTYLALVDAARRLT